MNGKFILLFAICLFSLSCLSVIDSVPKPPSYGVMDTMDQEVVTTALHNAGYRDMRAMGGTFKTEGSPRVLYLYANCVIDGGGVGFATIKVEGNPASPTITVVSVDRRERK
jgi:hypothetical protein